jgi:TatD DNase family protein
LLKISSNMSMAGRMSLFDVHCHLQDIRILQKAPELIKAATEVGVRWIAVNGTSEEDWQHVKQMGQDHSSIIIPCFGLHPWWINSRSENWLSNLKAMLESEPSAAVGEVGLCRTSRGKQVDGSLQLEILKQQLQLAREIHRPAAVHCVRAFGPLENLLEEMGTFPSGIILHSYTGNSQQVEKLAKHGAYFSFSGFNTRLKREEGRKVWRAVPKDRLLLETDCPDALPRLDVDSLVWVSGDPDAPFGSKCCRHDDDDDDDGSKAEEIKQGDVNSATTRKPGKGALNQPANIRALLSHVASLLDVTEEELAERAFENAKCLFSYQGSKVLS